MMTKTKTKRSAPKKSTPKASAAAGKQKGSFSRVAFVAVILVILLGYYLVTGTDPLEGLDPGQVLVPPADGWWQVYFTDPQRINDPEDLQGSIPGVLIDYIDAAQRSIHIAAFEFDLPQVAEALIAAHRRGVEVQWVTDDEHGIEADEDDVLELFAKLEKAGIEVKDDGRGGLMHNKFWIFDDQTVWTGSTNITVNGSFRNNNNVLVIDDPALAAIYEREFAEMWAGEFGPTSPSTVYDQAVVIDGTPVQVLFAAEDEVAGRLTTLIEGAHSSIRFMAFSFTHDEIGGAVLARARAGVDVKGIFETRGSETKYSEMPTLYCARVPVRQDGNPGTFHHKVFVIDEEMVVTGSLNFSENADESNDENVIIVTNPDIAARYLQEFERRWAEATEPDSSDVKCR
jgi:phosphatidylserine/phosphatidylglycerophosphate/cardiolipin synthase-like enzyme